MELLTTYFIFFIISFLGGFLGGLFAFAVMKLDFDVDFNITPIVVTLLAVIILTVGFSQWDKIANLHTGVCVMQIYGFEGERNWCWPQ